MPKQFLAKAEGAHGCIEEEDSLQLRAWKNK